MRAACVAIVAVGLLGASNAQAFSWGSWSSDYQESETAKTNYFDSIFDGHTYQTSWSWSNDDDFDLKKKIASVLDALVEKYWGDFAYEHKDYDEPRGETPVPEPTAALLFAIGVGVVATRRRF